MAISGFLQEFPRKHHWDPPKTHPLNVLCRLQIGGNIYVSSQVQVVKVGRWKYGKITELPYTTGVWGTSDMTWVVLPFWKCQSPRWVSHIFRAPVISSWIGLTPSSTNPKTSVAIDENVKLSTSTSPTCLLYCTPLKKKLEAKRPLLLLGGLQSTKKQRNGATQPSVAAGATELIFKICWMPQQASNWLQTPHWSFHPNPGEHRRTPGSTGANVCCKQGKRNGTKLTV